MQLVEEDTCLNPEFVPDLPPASASPQARLNAFRQASTGRLAVRYMVIAIADDAFAAPAKHLEIKRKFVEYFGQALAADGHDAADVFDSAFEACLKEQLIFGTEDAGYFGAGFGLLVGRSRGRECRQGGPLADSLVVWHGISVTYSGRVRQRACGRRDRGRRYARVARSDRSW